MDSSSEEEEGEEEGEEEEVQVAVAMAVRMLIEARACCSSATVSACFTRSWKKSGL